MELKDIQRHFEQVMNEQQNQPITEFESYSPFEMHQVILVFEEKGVL